MNRIYRVLCFFVIWAYCAAVTSAIIGGKIEEKIKPFFRHIVALLDENHGHICGGAIIGKRYLVSAAHCFLYSDNRFKSNRIFALMGTADLMNMIAPAVNVEIAKVYVPREYNAANVNSTGDIAVLKLKEPLTIAILENLKIIKIIRNKTETYSGYKAMIGGWGWNHIELHGYQHTGFRTDSLLRFATTDVYSHQQCQQEHPTLKITEDHLCAKIEQHEHEIRGVCYGDDGGPLVYNGILIGVLSKFLSNCNERISPAVYTRVSHHITFIRNAKSDHVTKNMRVHELGSVTPADT